MNRLILAGTAFFALSAPVMAQNQTELFVSNALMTRGYDEAAIASLTDAEIARLYAALM